MYLRIRKLAITSGAGKRGTKGVVSIVAEENFPPSRLKRNAAVRFALVRLLLPDEALLLTRSI